MSPPAWRKDDDRRAERDAEAKHNAEMAKEAQRRADEARRRAAEKKGGKK